MSGCQATNAADTNCPEKLGPDYDFGGSSAILETVNGKDERVYDPLQQAGGGMKASQLETGKGGLERGHQRRPQRPSRSGQFDSRRCLHGRPVAGGMV